MSTAPPLGICTGTVEPGVAFGGFGPSADIASQWRGSCIGGCGARPYSREESPTPTCLDCMRARHWPQGHSSGVPIGKWHPTVAPERWSWRPWNRLVVEPVAQPVKRPVKRPVTVLRPAVEVSPHDPSLPRSVRQLVELRPDTRVTLAVAADTAGGVVASLAVRAPGVGYAVYRRAEGGAWGFSGGALVAPHLRACNAGQFAAALRGVEYVPPAPRELATKGTCSGCGAEVSLTKGGAVYASHKCQTRAIEGRS